MIVPVAVACFALLCCRCLSWSVAAAFLGLLPLPFLVLIPEGDLLLFVPLLVLAVVRLCCPLLPLFVFAVILSAAKDPDTLSTAGTKGAAGLVPGFCFAPGLALGFSGGVEVRTR